MDQNFDSAPALEAALRDRGEVLARAGERYELYVIGGAAFLLHDPRAQATGDVDVAAQVMPGGTTIPPVPLPRPLQEAAAVVARIHHLRRGWINSAAAASFDHLVAEGAIERADTREWGGLVLRVASRQDLIDLKFEAGLRRGERGARYRRDLALVRPTDAELEIASRSYLERQIDPDSASERVRLVLDEIRRFRDA